MLAVQRQNILSAMRSERYKHHIQLTTVNVYFRQRNSDVINSGEFCSAIIICCQLSSRFDSEAKVIVASYSATRLTVAT